MNKTAWICRTCGIEYEASEKPPVRCPVCEDERQYVPEEGQQWTTLPRLNSGHRNILEKVSEQLYAIHSVPSFAIGQRAHLLLSDGGNILWDCISNLDESTTHLIKKLGGLRAIAISHPHYFSTAARWSEAFGDAPVFLHALDEKWLGRRTGAFRLWEGRELQLWDGMMLICCGGHFPGASVLWWPAARALLTGDTIQVCPDRKSVAFMYSYPNYIPLAPREVRRIAEAVEPLEYDAMFGAFGRYIRSGAREAMSRSLDRYLKIFR
jgi:glyoxylase-like metal-dependent hydrolase (beta-lactamase superfamily II)